MTALVQNLRRLARAELLLAQARIQVTARKVVLLVVALLFAVFALGMLNVAGYLALETVLGPAYAALAVAAADILLAVLIAVIAGTMGGGRDTEMVAEVREAALADIQAELQAAQDEVRHLHGEIVQTMDAVIGFAKNPLGAIGTSEIVALLTALAELIKPTKK